MTTDQKGCPELVYPTDVWSPGWECGRPIKRLGRCGIHARMIEQRNKRRDEWANKAPQTPEKQL